MAYRISRSMQIRIVAPLLLSLSACASIGPAAVPDATGDRVAMTGIPQAAREEACYRVPRPFSMFPRIVCGPAVTPEEFAQQASWVQDLGGTSDTPVAREQVARRSPSN